jgi:hypothetical protein
MPVRPALPGLETVAGVGVLGPVAGRVKAFSGAGWAVHCLTPVRLAFTG